VAVVRYLQKHPRAGLIELQTALYAEFHGLLTPSLGLLQAVLGSYAVQADGLWTLRPEDSPASRRADLEACAQALASLAARLDYELEQQEMPQRVITWSSHGQPVYRIHLVASAVIGRILRSTNPHPAQQVLVLPGGRSGLLAYKLGRDPSLQQLAADWRVLKFRQLRVLAGSAGTGRAEWEKELSSDPLEPPEQMKLF
jgi:hypothetical protein